MNLLSVKQIRQGELKDFFINSVDYSTILTGFFSSGNYLSQNVSVQTGVSSQSFLFESPFNEIPKVYYSLVSPSGSNTFYTPFISDVSRSGAKINYSSPLSGSGSSQHSVNILAGTDSKIIYVNTVTKTGYLAESGYLLSQRIPIQTGVSSQSVVFDRNFSQTPYINYSVIAPAGTTGFYIPFLSNVSSGGATLNYSAPLSGSGSTGFYVDLLVGEAKSYSYIVSSGSVYNITSGNNSPVVIKDVITNNYVFITGDAGSLISVSGNSDITGLIPAFSIQPFRTGDRISILQLGSGQLTISGSGCSLLSRGGANKIAGRYGVAEIICKSNNTWILHGDLI